MTRQPNNQQFPEQVQEIRQTSILREVKRHHRKFLFEKRPVQMQHEIALAAMHDPSIEEIRLFVQRKCQCAQMLPTTSSAQPFN